MYFSYEWLAYSCRCILNCDRVVEKETCTTQAVLTFISYILLFLNITSDSRLCFRCFLYCIKRVTLLTMPPMQNTHTHYMSPLLTVPPTHTPTHTNSHTPMQSSRQACCLICYFEPERHCDIKQLVYGERKKGGKSVRERKKRSERAAEGEQGSFIIKRMQLLKE